MSGQPAAGDRVVIDDLDALRAIADPLRHQLLGLLERPRSVKELASQLARPADRLYYHLRVLERHGFVRSRAGGSGRVYEAAAASIEIDPDLTIPAASVAGLVNGLLDRAKAELAAARDHPETDGAKRTLVSHRHIWLDEAERVELAALLETLDGRGAAAPRRGARRFGVLTGIWPIDDEDEAAG